MAHAATTLPKPAHTQGRDDSFSDRLRKARQDAGVTMAQMGIALGVSPQQVLKYERRQNRLCADRLPIWAATCGVTVDDLLGHTGRDTISLFGAEGVMSLVQAFTAITDASVRQTLIEMARALAIVDRQRRERPAG
ncbi:helix-turn-helix transcriptional regulator [Belnapia sp. T6]|uniref:Helix-turn-helix transcriptional regulator n=1 Tax=Belnapia mucosa TaxID=2804532 RepID=A0ABS1V4K3_9PROT|nr:helix-turn-helix domain-containing protein [Belnapia mucosa]MBL6456617.1 helix-turn-helix transcriptional regulator [Belnapia mucosa]